MACDRTDAQLDDYLDGELQGDRLRLFDRHIEKCAGCRQLVDRERKLRKRLANYGDATAPKADAAFFDRAIVRAIQAGTRQQRNRWVMTGFGGAVAALLAVWIVSGIFFTGAAPDQPSIPSVTMALESPQTFNLVFSSAAALRNASMTVTLPDGIEIDGFAGQREITWMTSLKEGRNILPLTLVATSPSGGELLATLRHEDDNKIFRLQVIVI